MIANWGGDKIYCGPAGKRFRAGPDGRNINCTIFSYSYQQSSKHNSSPSSLKIRPFRNRSAYNANSPTPLCQGHQRTRRQASFEVMHPCKAICSCGKRRESTHRAKANVVNRRDIPSRNTGSGKYSRKGCWCRKRYSSPRQYGGMQGPSFMVPGGGYVMMILLAPARTPQWRRSGGNVQ